MDRTESLRVLADVGARLSQPLDRRGLLEEIVAGARRLVGAGEAAVLSRAAAGGLLVVAGTADELGAEQGALLGLLAVQGGLALAGVTAGSAVERRLARCD